jgi:hypothetical protein
MTHITYIFIFHLKVIVCQNVNLLHTYGHRPQKHPFVIWYLSNSSHGSQTYSNHMESQCLVDTINFIKTKNHFNHFLNIFAFFNTQWHTFCCHKYILESHNISWKNEFSLCYGLPYYAKILEKHVPILPWLNFKYGHPWKTIQCDNTFGPPIVCFHP